MRIVVCSRARAAGFLVSATLLALYSPIVGAEPTTSREGAVFAVEEPGQEAESVVPQESRTISPLAKEVVPAEKPMSAEGPTPAKPPMPVDLEPNPAHVLLNDASEAVSHGQPGRAVELWSAALEVMPESTEWRTDRIEALVLLLDSADSAFVRTCELHHLSAADRAVARYSEAWAMSGPGGRIDHRIEAGHHKIQQHMHAVRDPSLFGTLPCKRLEHEYRRGRRLIRTGAWLSAVGGLAAVPTIWAAVETLRSAKRHREKVAGFIAAGDAIDSHSLGEDWWETKYGIAALASGATTVAFVTAGVTLVLLGERTMSRVPWPVPVVQRDALGLQVVGRF